MASVSLISLPIPVGNWARVLVRLGFGRPLTSLRPISFSWATGREWQNHASPKWVITSSERKPRVLKTK